MENSMDRGAWKATVHGVAKSQIGLSDYHFWLFGIITMCVERSKKEKKEGMEDGGGGRGKKKKGEITTIYWNDSQMAQW